MKRPIHKIARDTLTELDFIDKSVFHKNGDYSRAVLGDNLMAVWQHQIHDEEAYYIVGQAHCVMSILTNTSPSRFNKINNGE